MLLTLLTPLQGWQRAERAEHRGSPAHDERAKGFLLALTTSRVSRDPILLACWEKRVLVQLVRLGSQDVRQTLKCHLMWLGHGENRPRPCRTSTSFTS